VPLFRDDLEANHFVVVKVHDLVLVFPDPEVLGWLAGAAVSVDS
jgi:hypothetical protein